MVNFSTTVNVNANINDLPPLQARKLSEIPENVTFASEVNVTYTIENKYFEPLYNITLVENVPKELNVSATPESLKNTSITFENVTKITKQWIKISVNETLKYWIVFKVNINETKDIVLPQSNITFMYRQGIMDSITTNELTIHVEPTVKENVNTNTKTYRKLGEDEKPWLPALGGYLIPLLVAIFSYALMSLRRKTS